MLAYLLSTLLTRETNSTFLDSKVSIVAFESKLPLGRIKELGSSLGTKNSMQSGAILRMFRIKIANQRLSNRALVIFSMWSTNPPPHDDERSPAISTDISKAKKVPPSCKRLYKLFCWPHIKIISVLAPATTCSSNESGLTHMKI